MISLGFHVFLLLQTARITEDTESRRAVRASMLLQVDLQSGNLTSAASEEFSARDEVQGAWSAANETHPVDRRKSAYTEHQTPRNAAIEPLARVANDSKANSAITAIDADATPTRPLSDHSAASRLGPVSPPSTDPSQAHREPTVHTPASVPWQSPSVSASVAERASSEDVVDAEGLRQYRWDLAIAARRFRAQTDAIQAARIGVTELRIHIEDGTPHPALLQSSSGQNWLDQAAIRMLNDSIRSTPIPLKLRNKTFSITLRVEFGEE